MHIHDIYEMECRDCGFKFQPRLALMWETDSDIEKKENENAIQGI
jgi:hypothetical protein